MTLKMRLAANTAVQFVGKAITSLVTFLVTILIARQFGVDGFGEYTKIISYITLFYLAVDFGLNAVVLRREKETEAVFANLFASRIILALLFIFLSLGLLSFLPFNSATREGFTPFSKLGIILLSPTILTQAIFVSSNAWFQKKLRYDQSVLASSLGSFTTLTLVYLFISFKSPLLLTLTAYLVGSAVMAAASLFLSGWRHFRGSWSIGTSGRLLAHAFPLGLTLIFNLIYLRVDILLLTALRPTGEVGIYGLAYRFFELPLTFPTFFMNALYPVMLSYKNQDFSLLFILVRKAAVYLFLMSLVVTATGFLLSPLIRLVGIDFSAAIPVLRILLLFSPFFFLSSLSMWLLVALGRNTLLATIYLMAILTNTTLNLFFIPSYGAMAAATNKGITELLIFILTGYFGLRALKEGVRVIK